MQKSLICRIDKKLLIFYFVHTHLKCLFGHGKDRICIREIVVKHLTQQSTGKKWCQTGFRLDAEQVIFGEIGLSGEIRAVSQPNARLKEAFKLGFGSAITPPTHSKEKKHSLDMTCYEIGNVQRLINWFN